MAILHIDHVNIRTPRVAETVRFYVELLAMKAEPAPGADDMARGAWLYIEDGRAAVHVGSADSRFLAEHDIAGASPEGSGRVHHVAFECSDYDRTRGDLEARAVDFQLNDVPQIGLRQIFIRDPNGILVELNFR